MGGMMWNRPDRQQGRGLLDGEVFGRHLYHRTITDRELADYAVQARSIGDAQVQARHLGDYAVQARHLGDAEVIARAIAPGSVGRLQLSYTAAVDLANPLALPANTWTALGPALTFTVEGGGLVLLSVSGSIVGPGAAAAASTGARLNVDGERFPLVGGENVPAGVFSNFLSGSGLVALALVAGTHGVQLQLYSTQAGSVYCRPASSPNVEGLRIVAVELRR